VLLDLCVSRRRGPRFVATNRANYQQTGPIMSDGNVIADTRASGSRPIEGTAMLGAPLTPHSLENVGSDKFRTLSVEEVSTTRQTLSRHSVDENGPCLSAWATQADGPRCDLPHRVIPRRSYFRNRISVFGAKRSLDVPQHVHRSHEPRDVVPADTPLPGCRLRECLPLPQ
jgi:hypothetical protein